MKIKSTDPILQKAVQEMGGPSKFKGVEEIVTDPSSAAAPGAAAYVTNKDLVEGKPGEQQVIHVNLNDIKRNLGRLQGKPSQDVVKEYLKSVVLPHEHEHVKQLIAPQYPGEFGPSPEPKAERAEDWAPMEQYGIIKRFSNELDGISNQIEKLGMIEESELLDSITNSLEKVAAAPAVTPATTGGVPQAMAQIINSLKRSQMGADLVTLLENNRNNPDEAAYLILKNYLKFMVDAQSFNDAKKIAVKMSKGQTLQGILPDQQTQPNEPSVAPGAITKTAAASAAFAPTVLPMAVIMTLFSAKTGVGILQMTTQTFTKMIQEYKSGIPTRTQPATQRGAPTAPTAPQ